MKNFNNNFGDELEATATNLAPPKFRWKTWIFVFVIGLFFVHGVSIIAKTNLQNSNDNSENSPKTQQHVAPKAQKQVVRLIAPAEKVRAGQKLIEVPLMWVEVDPLSAPSNGLRDMKLALALYAKRQLEPNIPLMLSDLSIAPIPQNPLPK